MRRSVVVLVTVLGALSPSPHAVPYPAPGEPSFVPSAEAVEAYAHVRRLAGRIGPRPAGSGRYLRAAAYVRGELGTLGFEVARQRFRLPQGGRSWNLVARWPGATEGRLLIGAHLDTVPGSPGGNDNASGVAVLLDVAAALAGAGGAPPGLVLVAFGAEEVQPGGEHHLGSDAYVDRMSETERDALDMMVSADMIGKVRRYISGALRGTSRRAARILAQTARAEGFRAKVRVLGDISDHGPFALAGLPAAFLWTGWEPNHHRPTDVVRNCRPRALVRGRQLLLRLIEERLG